MRVVIVTALHIWAVALAASATLGREVVVDQRHSGASDQNPGTKSKPLKTISAAAAKVKAGDRVVIHGGAYRETVIIKTSGTAEAPIVFESAPGETPVIKGSEVITGWTRKTKNIWTARLPELPERSPREDEPSHWITANVRQVFIKDGVLLDAIHLRLAAPDALKEGNFFCDTATNELYIWLPESQDPHRLTIEASVRTTWLYVMADNIVIRRLQMRHASTLGIGNGPACSAQGNNVTFEDCAFTWGDFGGISFGKIGNKLLRCLVACNGNSGIGAGGQGHLIEGCRVLYNNIDRYDINWHCGGAKLIPYFSNSRVVGNEFAYNIGPGLWLDAHCNDNVVASNLCHDNEGAGIIVEISERNHVFNNICYANRNPLMAEFLQPDEDAAKRGQQNVFKTVRRGGPPTGQLRYHAGEARGIYVLTSPETKVYHNTCYLNEGEGICVEGPKRLTDEGLLSTRDCDILNNISAYNKGAQLVLRRNGIDSDTHGNKSDYNLLIAVGAVLAHAGWDAVFTDSLSDWQKSGNDHHSVQADPAFAMAAMGDFRLLPTSAAALVAPPLNEVTVEFFGSKRPSEKVSMGACEESTWDYPRATRPPRVPDGNTVSAEN